MIIIDSIWRLNFLSLKWWNWLSMGHLVLVSKGGAGSFNFNMIYRHQPNSIHHQSTPFGDKRKKMRDQDFYLTLQPPCHIPFAEMTFPGCSDTPHLPCSSRYKIPSKPIPAFPPPISNTGSWINSHQKVSSQRMLLLLLFFLSSPPNWGNIGTCTWSFLVVMLICWWKIAHQGHNWCAHQGNLGENLLVPRKSPRDCGTATTSQVRYFTAPAFAREPWSPFAAWHWAPDFCFLLSAFCVIWPICQVCQCLSLFVSIFSQHYH